MRRMGAVIVLGALVMAACGDGIDEGANQGRPSTRGTIDGVVLEPPGSPAPTTTAPGVHHPSTTVADTEPPAPGGDPFGWKSIGDGVDEGHLQVPLDYSDPSGAKITLYVVRHRATNPSARIGTLLVNPGGPGAAGSPLALSADAIYGQDLVDDFDIVGWDPRGTGRSTPAIDCIDEYDPYFSLDSSPDTPEERQALIDAGKDFAANCVRRNGEVLRHIGTVDSARDMDAIRAALGEEKISYFGFSYGSELGATWATLFPGTVRAMVIDGAVDPTIDYLHQNLVQAHGFETTFDTFLAGCSASAACAFHHNGDAEGAFDALSARIDAKPLTVDQVFPREVTQGVLDTAVADAMYNEALWPQLEQALADANRGEGQGLLALYDDYFHLNQGLGTDNETEAYFAIGCLDDHGSSGPDDLFTHEQEFAAAAPRLGRSWLAELTFCSVWPEPQEPPFTITGDGAGPIVVVGTTGDPATPLTGTKHMADALEDGRLVVVHAEQHTGYGANTCVDDIVNTYLIDPSKAPADGHDCG